MNLLLATLILVRLGDGWDIQFTEPFALDRPVDWIVLDPDTHGAETVAAMKARGTRTICYVSVGSVEDWRADLAAFPAAVIGKPLGDWPGERYLDIRRLDVLLPIMAARFRACRAAGYDGVSPDNMDLFEADTGFPLTEADGIAYIRALAGIAHDLELSVGQKNVPQLSAALVEFMDWAQVESCFQWGFCAEMAPYVAAGKPVFAIEYTDSGIDFAAACAEAGRQGLSMILKDRLLSGAVHEVCP
jgi:endo-alpha-1,4-polygalactosaminidase (GH114 family)